MMIPSEVMAGVDEVGRGPLAGPVVAAAVILNPDLSPDGLADSKTLSPQRRRQLAEWIQKTATAWAITTVSAAEIDQLNIRRATLRAMQLAVNQLTFRPHKVLVDGNDPPALSMTVETRIKGDQTVPAISAASIIAKVYRDDLMIALDEQYPDYGFAQHKGYPTPQHLLALAKYGPCPEHRRSFAPVRACLSSNFPLA